jgi:hypothetical protein
MWQPSKLRHYATSQKAANSRLIGVNEFFSMHLILPVIPGPGIYSASNRNKYQKQEKSISEEQSAAGM